MNLFESLDSLFSGTVQFFYNLIVSTIKIVTTPLTGPAKLAAAHLDERKSQVSGEAYLFISLLMGISTFKALAWGLYFDDRDASDAFGRWLSEADLLSISGIWPAILGALAATIIIDSTLRLVVMRCAGEGTDYRRLVLMCVEYAFGWLVIGLVAAGAIALLLKFGPVPDGLHRWQLILLVFGCSVVTAYPAARIIKEIGHQRATAAKAPSETRIANHILGVALLFCGAATAGVALNNFVSTARFRSEIADDQVVVTFLRCDATGPKLRVDGALWNRSKAAVAISFDDLLLLVGSHAPKAYPNHIDDENPDLLTPSEGTPWVMTIPPDGTTNFSATTEQLASGGLRKGALCGLNRISGGPDKNGVMSGFADRYELSQPNPRPIIFP